MRGGAGVISVRDTGWSVEGTSVNTHDLPLNAGSERGQGDYRCV